MSSMRIQIAAANILLVFTFTLPFPPALVSITFEQRYRQEAAKNPTDVQLVLGTTKSNFHPGEIIRLALDFSSASQDKYRLNAASYDRSGRLPTEQFFLDQEGVADPFIDYFGSGV